MKTTRLFSFLILISLVVNANAQLRVLSNGRVQAGLLKDNNDVKNIRKVLGLALMLALAGAAAFLMFFTSL